jgi:hypothetical protein
LDLKKLIFILTFLSVFNSYALPGMDYFFYSYSKDSKLFSINCSEEDQGLDPLSELSKHLNGFNCNKHTDTKSFCDCVESVSTNGLEMSGEEIAQAEKSFDEIYSKVNATIELNHLSADESYDFNKLMVNVKDEQMFNECFAGDGKFFGNINELAQKEKSSLTSKEVFKLELFAKLRADADSIESPPPVFPLPYFKQIAKYKSRLNKMEYHKLNDKFEYVEDSPLYNLIYDDKDFERIVYADMTPEEMQQSAETLGKIKLAKLCTNISDHLNNLTFVKNREAIKNDILATKGKVNLDEENESDPFYRLAFDYLKSDIKPGEAISIEKQEQLFKLDKLYCHDKKEVVISEEKREKVEDISDRLKTLMGKLIVDEVKVDELKVKETKLEDELVTIQQTKQDATLFLKVSKKLEELMANSKDGSIVIDTTKDPFVEFMHNESDIGLDYTDLIFDNMIEGSNKARIKIDPATLAKDITNASEKLKAANLDYSKINKDLRTTRSTRNGLVKTLALRNSEKMTLQTELVTTIGKAKADKILRGISIAVSQEKLADHMQESRELFSRSATSSKSNRDKFTKMMSSRSRDNFRKEIIHGISDIQAIKKKKTSSLAIPSVVDTLKKIEPQSAYTNKVNTKSAFDFNNQSQVVKTDQTQSTVVEAQKKTSRELELEAQLKALKTYIDSKQSSKVAEDQSSIEELKEEVELEKIRGQKDELARELEKLKQQRLTSLNTTNAATPATSSTTSDESAVPSRQNNFSNRSNVAASSASSSTTSQQKVDDGGKSISSAPVSAAVAPTASNGIAASSQSQNTASKSSKGDSVSLAEGSSFSLTSKVDPSIEDSSRVVKLDFDLASIPESNREIFLSSLFLEGEGVLVLEMPNGEKVVVENMNVDKEEERKIASEEDDKEESKDNEISRKSRLTHEDLKNILNQSFNESE